MARPKITAKQLADAFEQLAGQLNGRETISVEMGERLLRFLDTSPAVVLEMFVSRRVKFALLPAVRRLKENHGYSAEQVARLMHS